MSDQAPDQIRHLPKYFSRLVTFHSLLLTFAVGQGIILVQVSNFAFAIRLLLLSFLQDIAHYAVHKLLKNDMYMARTVQ